MSIDRRFLDGAVHPLDLPIGPGMLGLGEAMIDIVTGALYFEGMSPEWLASVEQRSQARLNMLFARRIASVGVAQPWRIWPIAHPSIPWKTMHHQIPGSNI